MTRLLPQLGLADVIAGLMVVALNAYVLMGGADFGGGVWDLLAWGPRRDEQRALVAKAIAPIWEANHVWLIIVVVMLFTAFPPVFAALGTVLHIPLSLLLVGIVLRGSAFVFRSYGSRSDVAERRWGRAFAIASMMTPVLLGVCIGAIATGDVGDAATSVEIASRARAGAPSFHELFVAPWLAPFPLAVGALALALFAMLAAVYLTLEARDETLRDDFRRRALGAAVAVFIAAAGALAIAHNEAPRMRWALTATWWALPLQIATAVAALTTLWALWRRRYELARLAAAAQVSLILWGWAFAQHPYLVPGTMTIAGSAAPLRTLELLLYALAGGAVVLLPSLVYLFRTFTTAGARTADDAD